MTQLWDRTFTQDRLKRLQDRLAEDRWPEKPAALLKLAQDAIFEVEQHCIINGKLMTAFMELQTGLQALREELTQLRELVQPQQTANKRG